MEDYRAELLNAGFQYVEVVDSGKDLNAYKKAENQSNCCSAPKADSPDRVSIASSSCCNSTPVNVDEDFTTILSGFDVNQAAASVKVYALKPAQAPCCGPTCCGSQGIR